LDIALVHGSYHGAWCWQHLTPELERLGHRVIAVELPISDPGLGAADYARMVEAKLDPDGETMLVGHSMAGLITPIVAAHRPIAKLVFLAAFLASPGRSANEQRAAEPIDGRISPITAEWTDLGDDVWMVGPRTATELFFHDAPRSVAEWACKRLRPQAYRIFIEPSPLTSWPDVESRSIVCRDDRAINPDWVRAASRERLGVEAIEMEGAHSPFLTRPAELARVLDGFV
jgi:pimeloyl-ACP methyl ester carboxylesterase